MLVRGYDAGQHSGNGVFREQPKPTLSKGCEWDQPNIKKAVFIPIREGNGLFRFSFCDFYQNVFLVSCISTKITSHFEGQIKMRKFFAVILAIAAASAPPLHAGRVARIEATIQTLGRFSFKYICRIGSKDRSAPCPDLSAHAGAIVEMLEAIDLGSPCKYGEQGVQIDVEATRLNDNLVAFLATFHESPAEVPCIWRSTTFPGLIIADLGAKKYQTIDVANATGGMNSHSAQISFPKEKGPDGLPVVQVITSSRNGTSEYSYECRFQIESGLPLIPYLTVSPGWATCNAIGKKGKGLIFKCRCDGRKEKKIYMAPWDPKLNSYQLPVVDCGTRYMD